MAEKVADFVVGHMELRALLEPALFCAKTAKKVGKRCGLCRKGGRVQMDLHFVWAHDALREVLMRFKQTYYFNDLVGVDKVEVGHSFLNILTEPSHPQMYSQHLNSMLLSAGQLIDKHGEPHVALPRGLVVGRAFQRQPCDTKVVRTTSLSSSRKVARTTTSSQSLNRSSRPGETLLPIPPKTSEEEDRMFASIPIETSLRDQARTIPIGLAARSPVASRPPQCAEICVFCEI